MSIYQYSKKRCGNKFIFGGTMLALFSSSDAIRRADGDKNTTTTASSDNNDNKNEEKKCKNPDARIIEEVSQTLLANRSDSINESIMTYLEKMPVLQKDKELEAAQLDKLVDWHSLATIPEYDITEKVKTKLKDQITEMLPDQAHCIYIKFKESEDTSLKHIASTRAKLRHLITQADKVDPQLKFAKPKANSGGSDSLVALHKKVHTLYLVMEHDFLDKKFEVFVIEQFKSGENDPEKICEAARIALPDFNQCAENQGLQSIFAIIVWQELKFFAQREDRFEIFELLENHGFPGNEEGFWRNTNEIIWVDHKRNIKLLDDTERSKREPLEFYIGDLVGWDKGSLPPQGQMRILQINEKHAVKVQDLVAKEKNVLKMYNDIKTKHHDYLQRENWKKGTDFMNILSKSTKFVRWWPIFNKVGVPLTQKMNGMLEEDEVLNSEYDKNSKDLDRISKEYSK